MEKARLTKAKKARLTKEMHSAVKSLDAATVQELLANGVPPDVWGDTDEFGDLPLQAVAGRNGEVALSIAKALIDAGADIDYQGGHRATALANAVVYDSGREDDWAMARFLIQAGADPSIGDRDGVNPAERASEFGRDDAVLAMLEAGMDPNLMGCVGPLIWYVAYYSPELVKALLSRGVDPDSKAHIQIFPPTVLPPTPLTRAMHSFKREIIDEDDFRAIAIALIEAGADTAQLGSPPPDCLSSYLLTKSDGKELEDAVPKSERASSKRSNL
jgi:ankyrin repeat protein